MTMDKLPPGKYKCYTCSVDKVIEVFTQTHNEPPSLFSNADHGDARVQVVSDPKLLRYIWARIPE